MNRLTIRGPTARHRDKLIAIFRPVVQSLGIEVGAVGPLNRPERLIKLYSIEERHVLKWAKHLALEDRPKIDPLPAAVCKMQRQRVGPDDVEPLNAMDFVTHEIPRA